MGYNPSYRMMLSRMGYYNYQSGLIYRHLGQEGGWDTHLERCRSYILRSVAELRPETITVLGSGWLLDLPLAELAGAAQKINLVDIVHPPEVFSQTSVFSNVRVIETDVSGGLIEEVWNKASGFRLFKKNLSFPGLNVPEFETDFEPGLLVSLNILTQLENLPVEFLKKNTRITEEEVNELRKIIQEKHLSFLMKNRSILISDCEEITDTGKDKKEIVKTMLVTPAKGNNLEEWTWDFDQKGSDYYNSRSSMKVVAMTYNG